MALMQFVTTGNIDSNGNEIDAPFDFEYDSTGQKFGAGTAFWRMHVLHPPETLSIRMATSSGTGTVFLSD